jgi:parallel beta-helix repeat protein
MILLVTSIALVCFGCKTAPAAVDADTWYVSAAGDDANDGLTASTGFKTLRKALDTATGKGAPKIITIAGSLDAESEGTVDGNSVFTVRSTGDAVITIRGSAPGAKLSALNSGKRVIEITGNSHIRLENIEISGGKITDPDITKGGGGGILIAASTANGASLVAGEGTVITGNQARAGGGVAVAGKGSGFTLDGGEVRENNSATDGGGILAIMESALKIARGKIERNTTAIQGGGVSVYNGATLSFDGGEITGNEARDGGGLHVIGVAAMRGGTISGNQASDNGGGVYLNSKGTFTLENGEILDNRAVTSGGGVSIYEGDFTMRDGVIAGNTASSQTGTGGGVFIIQGVFELSGGKITGNIANNSGGGVNANRDSTFTMSGGEIAGNQAVFGGGGVAVLGMNNGFKKTGGVIYGLDAPEEQRNTGTRDGNSVDVSRSSDLRVVVITDIKRRRNTTGESVNLDSTKDGAEGG